MMKSYEYTTSFYPEYCYNQLCGKPKNNKRKNMARIQKECLYVNVSIM